LLLVALAGWDWRAHRRLDVFPLAIAVLLLYHLGTLTLPLWSSFCAWFLAL
jgi:hypothetical protein